LPEAKVAQCTVEKAWYEQNAELENETSILGKEIIQKKLCEINDTEHMGMHWLCMLDQEEVGCVWWAR